MRRTIGTMLYDADCGFCTRTAAWVPRLRMRARVDSIQSSDLAALHVDVRRAVREIPYVHADGRVVYGHVAVAATLGTGPLPLRILAALLVAPGVSRIAGAIYRWVSEHRHELPGGTAECSINEQAG